MERGSERQRRFEPSLVLRRHRSSQPDGKYRSFPELTLPAELSAHPSGEIATDRQPKPSPLSLAIVGAIHLNKRLEDRLELVCWNPDARVSDVNEDVSARSPATHRDAAPLRGVANRIREQVDQDLSQFLGVGADLHAGPFASYGGRDPFPAGERV